MDNADLSGQSFARVCAALTSRLAAELERCFQDALRRALIDGLGAIAAPSPPPRKRAATAKRRATSAPASMTDNARTSRAPASSAPTSRAPASTSSPLASSRVDTSAAPPNEEPRPAESKPATSAPTNGAFARAPLVIPVRVRTRRRAPKRSADEIAEVESRIVAHVEKAPGAAAAAIAAAIGVPKGTVSWPLTKLVDGGKLVASTDAAGQKTYAPAPPPEPAKTRIIRRRAADLPRMATLPSSSS